ncbi:MAG: DUF1294 domain-containing protein [Geobacter sp.]|nr:DUF1294 domain-containing protein [Geobacter sp.]
MNYPNLATLYLLASTLAFTAYGLDKAAAITGTRRIPETFLHLLGFIGGWPGGLLAQRVFHHKSRKTSFRITFWIIAAINCVLALWVVPVPP